LSYESSPVRRKMSRRRQVMSLPAAGGDGS
jgi:hypothetical protein